MVDFERERNKKIVGSFAEEEKKQREKEEQDRKDAENKVLKRLKDSSFLLNVIYERNIGSKIW